MLFFHPDLTQSSFELSPEESGHIVKVLRLKSGDHIELTDGKGNLAQAIISQPNHRKCTVEIENLTKNVNPPLPIHIALAPTKSIDRTTWFVEKAVEIGIQKISFITCQRSERTVINENKVILKAISALKQSGGTFLPEISLNRFRDFIKISHPENEKYIAHLRDASTQDLAKVARSGNSYLILIGPEGDFTEEEINDAEEAGFAIVKMGNKRLRTETAALHACSIVNSLHY